MKTSKTMKWVKVAVAVVAMAVCWMVALVCQGMTGVDVVEVSERKSRR